MILKIETAIDLDANRKVWITGETDVEDPEDFAEAASALAEAVANQALTTYGKAGADIGVVAPSAEAILASAASMVPPSQRPKRPDDPPTMRAFGEDDDEDNAN